jgi:hypothetical protein
MSRALGVSYLGGALVLDLGTRECALAWRSCRHLRHTNVLGTHAPSEMPLHRVWCHSWHTSHATCACVRPRSDESCESSGVAGGRSLTRPFRDARPIPSPGRIVARTEGYTYAASVWDLSIVQGPFSVAPRQTLALRFAAFASLYPTTVLLARTGATRPPNWASLV